MAVIILKDADFSQSNVGQITLDVNISERTKLICQAYERDFTTEQQVALQNLIDWLDSEGILSSIDCLYMPLLADSLDKAFVNIAKYPYAVDITPSTSEYEIASNGVRLKSGQTGSGLLMDNITKAVVNNCHILVYNTESYETLATDTIYPYYYGGSIDTNLKFEPDGAGGHLTYGSQHILFGHRIMENGLNNQLASLSNEPSLKGINYNNISTIQDVPLYSPQKTSSQLKTADDWTDWTEALQKFQIDGLGKNMTKAHGLISIGAGMTDDQVIKYDEYVKKLVGTCRIIR